MKSLWGMIMFIITAFILAGCATTQSNAPAKHDTQDETPCARSCQSKYTQCNNGCSQIIGNYGISYRPKCFDNCKQTLKDCYSRCEQAPDQKEKKGM